MIYREPGVYVTPKFKAPAAASSSMLIPVIVGSGSTQFKKDITIRRDTGEYDILPSSTVNQILAIGDFKGSNDYDAGPDYTLENNILRWIKQVIHGSVSASGASSATLDTAAGSTVDMYKGMTIRITAGPGVGESHIIAGYTALKVASIAPDTWTEAPDSTSKYEIIQDSTNKPDSGSNYYVSYIAGPETDQYEAKLMSDVGDVKDFYGPDLDYATGLPCPVALGAKIALQNGSKAIYVVQVSVDGDTVAASDYQSALDSYINFLTDAYRIVPMDLDDDVFADIVSHVRIMSDPDERSERRALVNKETSAITFANVLTDIGGYATGLSDMRMNILYPNVASMTLSDGKVYDLSAQYLAAAFAGKESSQPIQIAMTKQTLDGFYQLKGVKMTRVQKNLLAAKGVTVLQQDKPGLPIFVRHGLTTDMTSVQTRENSVVTVADYATKTIRTGLEPYIGKEVITNETLARIENSVVLIIADLVRKGILVSGTVDQLYQDASNPDTIIVQVTVTIPTPVNYVDVTLYIQ